MSDTGVGAGIRAVLPGVETAVDALVASVVGACTADEVLDVWTRLETVRRRLAVVEHAIIAQVQRDGLAHHHGARSTPARRPRWPGDCCGSPQVMRKPAWTRRGRPVLG